MATTEFQSTTNLLNRVLDKIKLESRVTSVSILAVVISVVGLIVSSLISIGAWSDAKEARIRVEYQDAEIILTKNKTNLYIVYVQDLHFAVENNLPLPPLPEIEE